MKEHYIYVHNNYLLSVDHDGFNYEVSIKIVGGHWLWCVLVVAPLNINRWDLGDAAVQAYRNQQTEIDIA